MEQFSDRHRRWVATFLQGKVKELHYNLNSIVTACDRSMLFFSSRKPIPADNEQAVVFGFSAFSNVVQTLKDAVHTVVGEKLPWSRIETLRHGAFMKHVRNAATHDGHPVVSAWSDGRYFVPRNIVRLDLNNKIVEIPAPSEDIRTLCLEFSIDYCQLLKEILSNTENNPQFQQPSMSIEDLEDAINRSNFMPEFVKNLFANNREEITKQIASADYNPIKMAIDSLDRTICFCEEATRQSPKSNTSSCE